MHDLMPTACDTTISTSKVMRKVLCMFYGTCLDYAIEQDWDGFF